MRKMEIEWQGESTVPEVAGGLKMCDRIELSLPNNFNHALFAHFYPNAVPGVEELNIHGGAEVLRRAAEVDGLEDLQALVDLVVDEQAHVRIISPPRIIISRDATDEPLR